MTSPRNVAENCSSRNRGKDAVTAIRRDHPCRAFLPKYQCKPSCSQVFKVAKDDAERIGAFNVGSGLDELGDAD